MKKSNLDRRKEITAWALHGTHNSLGFSGWPSQSEQILFMAERENLYSPFDSDRAALYQTNKIFSEKKCLPSYEAPVINSEIINNDGAIAAGIFIEKKMGAFDEVWLCSSKISYRLTSEESQQNLVFDKKNIIPGDYSIYFLSNSKLQGASNKTLKLKGEKYGVRCQAHWGVELVVAAEARKEFCKKVFK